MGVKEHCHTACSSLLSPSDPSEAQSLHQVMSKNCLSALTRSNYDGKICRTHFLQTGLLSCQLSCEHLVQGNALSNKPEFAQERRACDKYSGGQYDQFSKKACEMAVKTSSTHFAKAGIALRSKIDEMCATVDDDKSSADEPEIEEIASPKGAEVKRVTPVVEKEPIRASPQEPVEITPEERMEAVEIIGEVIAMESMLEEAPATARKLRKSVEMEV